MDVVDVASAPAIAAIVWGLIQAFGGQVPAQWKPPAAAILGIGWALLAFGFMQAYPNPLIAVSVGLTAGMAASGIESYRATYKQA